MLRFCLALLVFNEPGDVLAAVIGEPQVSARRANALGNSAARSELWDQGKVNYVVQTEESSPGAQFPHLPEDYQPVIDAIAEWEKKTCIRFTRCRIEADCPKPYLVFRHSITWKCEITAVEPGVLHIVLSVLCGSDANRMIGRVMGLDDEFMRSDRDNYVRMTNEYGQTVNADPSSSLGRRNIGVYDYASIMHQKRAVSDAGLLIETTEVIGASRALSEGDVAAIDFMYNGCSNTYAAPRCITNASAVLLIPHSKEFVVEFNADWNADSSMTISYGSTTAPRASFHTVPGTNVGHSATAFITFNPLLADAGSTFMLAATFTSTAGDKYTSISYYIATNDSSVIGIGQAETRFRGCWWMTIAATGLKFASSLSSSDTDIFVNMPIELNRFYFVEHLIDYSTGMMTVRVDGEVKIENFASKSGTTCISHGIGGFAFRRKGWVDELRLQVACSLYELTGSMTSPDHRGLDGGMLTVSIKGDPDVWVDTEATKQALIDGLVAVTSSTALTGWNALKSTMMDTSLVSISGSKMTLGPLNPVAYSATSATVVSLTLTASMAASGTLKRGSGGLFFVIPAPMCFSDRDITFNSDSATFPNSMVDTSFKAEGRGSAYFGESGASVYSVSEPLNRGRFLYISYYIAMNDTDYLPSIDILDSSLNSCWVMEITSTGLLFHGNIVADMPLELNRFYFVENLIDPYTRAMTVRVDGAVKLEYPLAMKANSSCNTGIDHIVFWRKGWLDRLRLQQHCLWH
ncbi:hypothetical protein DIPPA_22422 [Diplonema papillatum]|nr:hypothetical protein DIPPA_22422 [Diplonema papillatum]